MTIRTTKRFDQNYAKLPNEIQQLADKQLTLWVENSDHPSLHIKKMGGYINRWEGRITRRYRFTFEIVNEIYILRRIGTHDILKNP